jgi:two-component system, chemotaxis family, chemotaxis protein CheY
MLMPKDLTILIIEDMSFYRSFIIQSLKNLGFHGKCFIANNVMEARERIGKSFESEVPINFIISDLHLPDGLGTDIAQEIRAQERTSKIPVLLLTVEDNSKAIVNAFESGIDNYMFKPIEEITLMEKMEFCWKNRHSA